MRWLHGLFGCVWKKRNNDKDSVRFYNAFIDEEKCIKCGRCHEICQRNNELRLSEPIEWYQGWSSDEESRKKSASGGFGYEIAKKFIENRGTLCACVFDDGEFKYEIFDDITSIESIRGSRYVKSNPSGMYKEVLRLLKEGRRILVIGLPCHIAAFRNFVPDNMQNGLYLADLICHGTPSPKLLKSFLEQYKVSRRNVKKIKFCNKEKFAIGEVGVVPEGVLDRYTLAYLNSILHTDNCYNCKYATVKRCSDVTIGDSWGTEIEKSEQEKGISLAIVFNEKGRHLIEQSDTVLMNVDAVKATAANRQLNGTSTKPPQHDKFYEYFEKGKSFNYSVLRCFPKTAIKQDIKGILICLNLYKGGVPYRISIVQGIHKE